MTAFLFVVFHGNNQMHTQKRRDFFYWNDQMLKKACEMTVLFLPFFHWNDLMRKRRKNSSIDNCSSISKLFFTKRFWHLFLIQIDGTLEFELQTKPAAWHEFKHLEIITSHTTMERRIIFWLFTWRSMEKKIKAALEVCNFIL